MRQWLSSFLLLSLIASDAAQSAETKKPQRLVEIQWGEAENVAQYIVEIRHFQGTLLKTFSSKKPLLKFKAPIGDYEIRAKVEGIDGRIGEFSEWNRITVLPREVVFKDAPSQKVLEADSKKLTGTFSLTWPKEETAQEYRVRIFGVDNSVVQELTLDRQRWEVDLPPGEYRFAVTSINGKFSSEEVYSPLTLIIGNAQLAAPEMIRSGADANPLAPVLAWKALKGIQYKVQLKYHKFMADEFEDVVNVPEPLDGVWSPAKNSPPGQYQLSVWAHAPGFRPSPPLVEEFSIKPREPLLKDVDKEVSQVLQLDE